MRTVLDFLAITLIRNTHPLNCFLLPVSNCTENVPSLLRDSVTTKCSAHVTAEVNCIYPTRNDFLILMNCQNICYRRLVHLKIQITFYREATRETKNKM